MGVHAALRSGSGSKVLLGNEAVYRHALQKQAPKWGYAGNHEEQQEEDVCTAHSTDVPGREGLTAEKCFHAHLYHQKGLLECQNIDEDELGHSGHAAQGEACSDQPAATTYP